MKILFITNYPSPYRVEFFNKLGHQKDINLTVLFLQNPKEISWRSSDWFDENYSDFKAVFLKDKLQLSKRITVFKDIFPYLRDSYDHIIFGGYSYPTFMLAMEYLRKKGIPYIIEIDGGLIKQDSYFQSKVKRHFLSSAAAYFCPGEAAKGYLTHYGANPEHVFFYPFTSFNQMDLDNALGKDMQRLSLDDWIAKRITINADKKKKLGINCKLMALFIGQFVPGKGIDVLLHVAGSFKDVAEFYFVGGEKTKEYQAIVEAEKLDNVHFVGFKKKNELAEYYRAADLFVMPTRYDVWGLVIEEAMAYGLPIISTDKCGAALDLVKDGKNGYICQADNVDSLLEAMKKTLQNNFKVMGYQSYQKIQSYTIDNMVKAHIKAFREVSMK